MQTVQPIINKAAQKAIVTIDLADFFPASSDIVPIDLKNYLFKELLLKEADFRDAVKNTDWSIYKDKYVVLFCSTPAIIPMWAYMVLSAELSVYAKDVACTTADHAAEVFLYRNIAQINLKEYEGKRVVIKGCGERPIPEAAFVQITQQLAPVARAVNYGEACSMVPVFKKNVNQ
ncbi:MAG: DUF2480 family protein [Bacteroidetes bacterium]|nr:DUF2480 family protein [Bacteroidota bacterium]